MMKTNNETKKKSVTVVQQLREVRDKLNEEIMDLSPKELVEFFKKKQTLQPKVK